MTTSRFPWSAKGVFAYQLLVLLYLLIVTATCLVVATCFALGLGISRDLAVAGIVLYWGLLHALGLYLLTRKPN